MLFSLTLLIWTKNWKSGSKDQKFFFAINQSYSRLSLSVSADRRGDIRRIVPGASNQFLESEQRLQVEWPGGPSGLRRWTRRADGQVLSKRLDDGVRLHRPQREATDESRRGVHYTDDGEGPIPPGSGHGAHTANQQPGELRIGAGPRRAQDKRVLRLIWLTRVAGLNNNNNDDINKFVKNKKWYFQ